MKDLKPWSVAERIDLVRTTLKSFPDVAQGADRERFRRLLENFGVEAVFDYLRSRGIAHAALAAHSWSPGITDMEGPFWLFRQFGLAVQETHRREVAHLAESFARQGIPLIAYKGVVLEALLSSTDTPSCSADIDILVPKAELSRAKEMFENLGYVSDLRIHAGRPRKIPPQVTAMTEGSIYSFGQCVPLDRLIPVPELAPLGARLLRYFPERFCLVAGQLQMKLSIDLHYTLNHLSDDIGTRVKPSEEVWLEDTESLEIEGVAVETLSHRVLSWVLPHRLYVDSMLLNDGSIRALCHLKLLRHYGKLDVEHAKDISQRYPYLAPSIYYALRAMDQICETNIRLEADPEKVRKSSAPLMNVGDCLPAMLDFGLDVELIGLNSSVGDEEQVAVRLH